MSPEVFKANTVHSPHVVFHGSPFDAKSETYIYIDGEPMLCAITTIDAFLLLYTVYYSLWLQFPKACESSYRYLEVELFKKNTSAKLPAKLSRFMSSL